MNPSNRARVRLSALVGALLLLSVAPSWAQSATEHAMQGDRLREAGDYDAAATKYRAAIEIESNNVYATYWLGWIQAQQGHFSEAVGSFQRVVEDMPAHTAARVWLGLIQLRLRQVDDAEATFQALAEHRPDSRQAQYYLGVIQYLRHEAGEALRHLNAAKELDPNEAGDRYRLGRAYHDLGMFQNAILEYKHAMDTVYRASHNAGAPLTPDMVSAYVKSSNDMGWAYYHLGDTDRAVEQWQMTRQVDPRDRDARANLAKVYNELASRAMDRGDRVQARSYWTKALSAQPRNKAATHHLKRTSR